MILALKEAGTSGKGPIGAHTCKWASSLMTVWLMGRVWEIGVE